MRLAAEQQWAECGRQKLDQTRARLRDVAFMLSVTLGLLCRVTLSPEHRDVNVFGRPLSCLQQPSRGYCFGKGARCSGWPSTDQSFTPSMEGAVPLTGSTFWNHMGGGRENIRLRKEEGGSFQEVGRRAALQTTPALPLPTPQA